MGLFDFISAKAREEQRKERMKNAGNIAMGTLLGLAAGAAASYLFAPRSGEETREMIAKKSKETYNDMKDGIANATQRATCSPPVSYTHLRAHETGQAISYAVFCLKKKKR